MASIIEGYNYDIFISYRQKDNKGDKWVSQFVEALKDELEATFKEQISVYFDINPSDYLLETYDVDASLKGKLKCLVFIPILSRTYCDSKSFAWVHEFKAFVEEASKDQYGLKVKLPNGNVAGRVLPVIIHDLDPSDIKECESTLGGVLRGIDFIYKEAGIDKPLAPGDNEKKNLNNTTYRIQIIKVAHAIKEIIQGLKSEPVTPAKEKTELREPVVQGEIEKKSIEQRKPLKLIKSKLFLGVTIVAILIIASVLVYLKALNRGNLEDIINKDGRIPIVVMPFQNRASDASWQESQGIIQDIIKNRLSYSPELIVRQTEAIPGLLQSKGVTDYASITPSLARTISKKMETNVLISGSINQVGDIIRLQAELIDSKTGAILKPFQIDGSTKEDNCIDLGDSLSVEIANFMILSILKKEHYHQGITVSTNSPEAYKEFINGLNSWTQGNSRSAAEYFIRAIEIDSNYIEAYVFLSNCYKNLGNYDQAKKMLLKIYDKRDLLSPVEELNIEWLYALLFEDLYEENKYIKKALDIDDQHELAHYVLGFNYTLLNQYGQAKLELEKCLEICNRLDMKPNFYSYVALSTAYHNLGQYKKGKKLYKKAIQDYPDNTSIVRQRAILSLSEEDTIEANEYIEKYKSIRRAKSASEAGIKSELALIYSEAGIPDKAEEYYRQALSLEPENWYVLNNLAYLLIDNDRNVNEGIELIDKALELVPDNYTYLDTKGWGLYMQGKYQEALDTLQKSWDLRIEKAIYNHNAFLHLEAAKKAVAEMK